MDRSRAGAGLVVRSFSGDPYDRHQPADDSIGIRRRGLGRRPRMDKHEHGRLWRGSRGSGGRDQHAQRRYPFGSRTGITGKRPSRPRDLSFLNDRIGDALVAQGDLPRGLTSYQTSHGILERLAQSDAGNAGWQRDLAGGCDAANRPRRRARR
jgi:hypothetical protein